jgi:hypothetical protein
MKFLFVFFLFPLQLFAQDITGVWTGAILYDDTTKQPIKYELALSEYNGKLDGYSHTIFIIDSVENIGVKSLKIKKAGEDFFLEDDKLIYNNYPEPPAKGVKTYSKLTVSQNDSVMMLSGPWNTNQTRLYKSLTGNIHLQKKKDFKTSLIIQKLDSLKLAHSLSFMPSQTHQAEYEIANISDSKKPQQNTSKEIISTNNVSSSVTVSDRKDDEVSIENKNKITDKQVPAEKINSLNAYSQSNAKDIAVNPNNKIQKSNLQNENKVADKSIFGNNGVESKQVIKAAAEVATRKIEAVKSVEIKSDSLLLTLYDNGEIDGDTVSVLLNGKVIMPMQGLTANGISKTIYLTPEMGDSITLIMYAENLGSIPPNTGLLVVHDGEDIYEIRFSGDLQKNSSIILKRKKKINSKTAFTHD